MASPTAETSAQFWDDERTTYVAKKILSAYPKLSEGAQFDGGQFDKAFRTEAVVDGLKRFYSDPNLRCIVITEDLKIIEVIPAKIPRGKGPGFD